MKYGFTIGAADLAVANSPELGGESKRVSLSYEQDLLVASVALTAPTSGTMTMESPSFDFDPVNGNDLHVRAENAIGSAADVALTFAVTFADNSGGTATAAFTIPSFAENTTKNIPMGLTVDLNGNGAGAGKKIKSIAGLVSVTGGSRGSTFALVALPNAWFDLRGCTAKNEQLNVPKPKNIAFGLNASEWTKFGMSEIGQMELEAFHISAGDGLQRMNAHQFSTMVETWAEDRVLKQRSIYCNCRGAFHAKRGDGEDEVKDRGTADFTRFYLFV